MWKISNLKVGIDEDSEQTLRQVLCKKLKIADKHIASMQIVKKAIDARKKDQISFNYTVHLTLTSTRSLKGKSDVLWVEDEHFDYPSVEHAPSKRPVVVGFGPAGIMAAYVLAKAGACPVVYERGGSVEERIHSIDAFWKEGLLDPESNVQFGEGGAGTFSDGKLTARSKDIKALAFLEALVEAGAPKEILYEAHPHIGTDQLRGVVVNMRKSIEAMGGTIHFNTRVDDFWIEDDVCRGVIIAKQHIEASGVILAIGHSAHDTFETLYAKQVAMEPKPFAVGVRVEHLQTTIDEGQYGALASHPALKSAEYRMTHTASNGRGVYTFCMCPGGYVVASSSLPDTIVTNGMSEYARDGANANAAVLVQVGPKDFGDHPLAGLRYQRSLEQAAFVAGGGAYRAPAQRVVDYLAKQPSTTLGKVVPTYSLGVHLTNLHPLFSKDINQALEEGLVAFGKQLPGYLNEDALMTGVETRSSCPLRITRYNTNCQAIGVKCLYPSGEGAGYAGGIVSAGVDGIRCALALVQQLKGELNYENIERA
ncbi:MAG: NAD(P)/FAD-dependent oxidoreductase [Erysipelotrichaceae bacterium]